MTVDRRKTKVIYLGETAIGGGNPVTVQSMTKTQTTDVDSTVTQIRELEEVGCDIIRVAVPDKESVECLPDIIKKIHIPLIADIHFDYRLAVTSIDAGASGIRINPGNIGGKKALKKVVEAARKENIPIRVGVNSGSLEKRFLKKHNGITAEALVESALHCIKLIEDEGYDNLKVSIKTPDVRQAISSYRQISEKTDYPLHLGVTEAGPLLESAVRSSLALGTLLMEGIGDTVRVSVTGDPVDEVLIAREIIQSLGLRGFGPKIISCPTCARCKVDLVKIVRRLRAILLSKVYADKLKDVKIAVMGCIVNGPGEARDADIGVACGKGKAVLFKKGKPVKDVNENDIVEEIINEMD